MRRPCIAVVSKSCGRCSWFSERPCSQLTCNVNVEIGIFILYQPNERDKRFSDRSIPLKFCGNNLSVKVLGCYNTNLTYLSKKRQCILIAVLMSFPRFKKTAGGVDGGAVDIPSFFSWTGEF